MDVEPLLEEIGLSKNEIKIYLILLKLGSTTTGAIIKQTGIHNSKVYDGLERLSNKGLVTHVVVANTKHFTAVNPERLLDFLEDKKKLTKGEKEKRAARAMLMVILFLFILSIVGFLLKKRRKKIF